MSIKGQISYEFILIFTLVLLAFIGFLAIVNNRISDINEEKEYMAMRQLAEDVRNEVILASGVHDNYLRRFEIPLKLEGKNYSIELNHDFVDISMNDKSVTRVLPLAVKGTFVENIDPDTLDHCITKNSYDGIRIARNLAIVELQKETIGADAFYEVSQNEIFNVYVGVFCIEDITGLQFSLKWDPSLFKVVGGVYDPENFLIDRKHNPEDLNPLVDEMTIKIDYSSISYSYPGYQSLDTVDLGYGRMTFGFLSTPTTGSGYIAKIPFRAIGNGVKSNISFDIKMDELHDGPAGEYGGYEPSLLLLDKNTGLGTTEGLPDNKQGATIRIV